MILRLGPSALFLRVPYYVIASLYYSNFWKNQKYSSKSPEIQFFCVSLYSILKLS